MNWRWVVTGSPPRADESTRSAIHRHLRMVLEGCLSVYQSMMIRVFCWNIRTVGTTFYKEKKTHARSCYC
jgi:hypothetical protein